MTASRKQSSPAVKAGVYTRISSDPSGQRAGVERQRADCEAHCLARGWDVVEVFCDNDAPARRGALGPLRMSVWRVRAFSSPGDYSSSRASSSTRRTSRRSAGVRRSPRHAADTITSSWT